MQILAATMVTAGLLILAVAQLPVLSSATGKIGAGQLRLLRPSTGEYAVHVASPLGSMPMQVYCKGYPGEAQCE